MGVQFFFNESGVKLTNRRRLKSFLQELFIIEGYSLFSLRIIFCSDNFLLSINKEFLQHDTYTDIITFYFSESGEPVDGEIYISSARVYDNASAIGVPFNFELHRVIFHGALHLCGYKDKVTSDKLIMTSAENKYLDLYFC